MVSQEVDRLRRAAGRNPGERLVSLLHHVNRKTLRAAFPGLRQDAAAGVDPTTWEEYKDELWHRMGDLHDRIHSGAYRAPPSLRVYIPKPDGGQRPLGIASLEDKIVQKAVTDNILVPIYETEFLGFSYGFRPGRGAQGALDAVTVGIERRKINWICDADIRSYFDTIDRGWLLRFLELCIGDKRLLRLIIKWLNAGVMDGGAWKDSGVGTPQGAIVSPVLANIYLHYVLDLWFERVWRKGAAGDTIIIRYADDFVVGFQYKSEAERFLKDLDDRFAKFGLQIHPQKTRLLEFGRFAEANRKTRGQGKPETFDFLGMTHFCAKTRKGWFRVGRKPIAKRVIRTLKRVSERLRRVMHLDIEKVAEWLGRVVDGWLNYFAVPGSYRYLTRFVHELKRRWMKSLRRRSQKDRFEWKKLEALCKRFWPRVRIKQPWPDQRLVVKT